MKEGIRHFIIGYKGIKDPFYVWRKYKFFSYFDKYLAELLKNEYGKIYGGKVKVKKTLKAIEEKFYKKCLVIERWWESICYDYGTMAFWIVMIIIVLYFVIRILTS